MGSFDGAHVLVQGSKRGKVKKKGKKVLPIDIKFKAGLSGEPLLLQKPYHSVGCTMQLSQGDVGIGHP